MISCVCLWLSCWEFGADDTYRSHRVGEISHLYRSSRSLGLFYHVPLKRDQDQSSSLLHFECSWWDVRKGAISNEFEHICESTHSKCLVLRVCLFYRALLQKRPVIWSVESLALMIRTWAIELVRLIVSYAEYSLFYRALLQKRPVILSVESLALMMRTWAIELVTFRLYSFHIQRTEFVILRRHNSWYLYDQVGDI